MDEHRNVSGCRLWRCPACNELLEKQSLGSLWQAGDPISKVAGTGTCSRCGTSYPQTDIYGGRYDVTTAAKTAPYGESGEVSVLVFSIMSRSPPSDAQAYCKRVLASTHPAARLGSYYVVGFMDNLAPDEALAMYDRYVRGGQLPDLGEQFDSFTGPGPQGGRILALFFRPK